MSEDKDKQPSAQPMNINIDTSGSRAFTLKALEFLRWAAENKVKAAIAVAIANR